MPDLTTLAALKAWDSSLSGANADVVLSSLISAVSADFLRECERPNLLTQSYTENRFGDGSPRMVLRNWPITAVANVTVAGTALASGNFYFDQQLDPERTYVLYLTNGYTFTDGAPVAITYTAGYATPPLDVAQAVIEWCMLRWKKKPSAGATQVRNIEGERSDVDPSAIPGTTQRVIELYKRKWPSYGRSTEAAPAAAPQFGRKGMPPQQGGR